MRLSGLWRHPDFVKFWAGQTVSLFGSQITLLALPLAAALTLDATPGQMGLLSAAGSLPGLIVGLPAGVWVDRHRRRPVLIWSNAGRALVLAAVPAAAALDMLRIELLYAVALTAGVLQVFFQAAYGAYLPALVGRAQIVEGNSRLQVSQSAARVAGPSLAGVLVQAFTAPVAIALDAASFLVSAVSLALVRAREPAPARAATGRSLRGDLAEGLGVVLRDPILRPIAVWAGVFNFFGAVVGAVLVLFVTRDLGLRPDTLGVVFAAGGLSGLVGALLAGRFVRRFGLGPSMLAAGVVASVSQAAMLVAAGPAAVAAAVLIASQLAFGVAAPLLQINIASLQQAATPPRLLGRVNATMGVVIVGTLPAGALVGGALGEAIGLRGALAVGVLGIAASPAFLWWSPLRSLREPPAPAEDAPAEEVAAAPLS